MIYQYDGKSYQKWMILRKLLGNLMRKSHGWFIKEMDDLRKPSMT